MNTEATSARLADFVNAHALSLALLPEDETIQAIKALRAGLLLQYSEVFEGAEEEVPAFVMRILECVLIQRNDLHIHAGVNATRTLH